MKTIQLRTPGGPEVLELVDLPLPKPGPGQVNYSFEAPRAGSANRNQVVFSHRVS